MTIANQMKNEEQQCAGLIRWQAHRMGIATFITMKINENDVKLRSYDSLDDNVCEYLIHKSIFRQFSLKGLKLFHDYSSFLFIFGVANQIEAFGVMRLWK